MVRLDSVSDAVLAGAAFGQGQQAVMTAVDRSSV